MSDDAARFRPLTRVYLAHHDQAWAGAARAALDATGVTPVVGQAGGGTAAWDDLVRLLPEVVVLAADLPGAEGVGGLALCRRINDELASTAVLVVAADADGLGTLADAALDAGAVGGCASNEPVDGLADKVIAVRRGGAVLPPAWANHALAVVRALEATPARQGFEPSFGADEVRILEVLGTGAGEARVAAEAVLPVRWVRGRAGSAWRKLVRFRDDSRLTTPA